MCLVSLVIDAAMVSRFLFLIDAVMVSRFLSLIDAVMVSSFFVMHAVMVSRVFLDRRRDGV